VVNNEKQQIVQYMKEKEVDAVALVPGTNLRYITGNKLSQSERLFLYFLKHDGQGIYLVPEVEKSKIIMSDQDSVFSYTDGEGPSSLVDKIKDLLPESQKTALETNNMRLFEFEFLSKLGMKSYIDVAETLNPLRIQKNADEISKQQKAVDILEESLKATLPFIEVGKTEMEIAAQLEYEMRVRGSEGTPFSTIVASGYRGALPHGRASEKIIENGDLIVIDFGSIYKGYVGDMTRTVGIGDINAEQREVYNIVKSAISNAIDAIKIGEKVSNIDTVARNTIKNAGYGDYFTHRLGHGIGLDAHESPYISQSDQNIIQSGMTFTIEPGIYLENKFGIRIEDNIAVTEDKIINLMNMNQDLIILP